MQTEPAQFIAGSTQTDVHYNALCSSTPSVGNVLEALQNMLKDGNAKALDIVSQALDPKLAELRLEVTPQIDLLEQRHHKTKA